MDFQLQRIQHVSIPYPPGEQTAVYAFYRDLLGLEELPLPATFAGKPYVWFRLGDTELHLVTDDEPDAGHYARHFCIVVAELEALRRQLEKAGYSTRTPTPIPHRPRFMVRDPFGNLIEFTRIEGNYIA